MSLQFNRQKLKNLVLLVCNSCQPSELGGVKLHKVLYFSDMLYYAATRRPITGETYVKQTFGPVAKHLPIIIRELVAEGRLEESFVNYYGFSKREFRAAREPDLSHFAADELATVRDVVEFVCRKNTAKTISEFSHTRVWEAAEMGEELPYFTVYAMYPAEISEDYLAWGHKEADLIASEGRGSAAGEI
jgi:hypothetical protein